jgi:hypothetical protein
MTEVTLETPWHLWLVGVIAVLFNAIGAFDYVMNMAQGGSYMASAGTTPAQIAHYQAMPIWMLAVWTIGVWGAVVDDETERTPLAACIWTPRLAKLIGR